MYVAFVVDTIRGTSAVCSLTLKMYACGLPHRTHKTTASLWLLGRQSSGSLQRPTQPHIALYVV